MLHIQSSINPDKLLLFYSNFAVSSLLQWHSKNIWHFLSKKKNIFKNQKSKTCSKLDSSIPQYLISKCKIIALHCWLLQISLFFSHHIIAQAPQSSVCVPWCFIRYFIFNFDMFKDQTHFRSMKRQKLYNQKASSNSWT